MVRRPAGLRYGLSTTNCMSFPSSETDVDNLQQLFSHMAPQHGVGEVVGAGEHGGQSTAPTQPRTHSADIDLTDKTVGVTSSLARIPSTVPALPSTLSMQAKTTSRPVRSPT